MIHFYSNLGFCMIYKLWKMHSMCSRHVLQRTYRINLFMEHLDLWHWLLHCLQHPLGQDEVDYVLFLLGNGIWRLARQLNWCASQHFFLVDSSLLVSLTVWTGFEVTVFHRLALKYRYISYFSSKTTFLEENPCQSHCVSFFFQPNHFKRGF